MSEIIETKKTPLYDAHVAAGGEIVPFAGYYLPVRYGAGVIAEHMNVRTKVGLFDVSHMGEVVYKGPDALYNLNTLLANDFTNMYDGQARYSPMLNHDGGFIDDLIVYKKHEDHYMVVVNASNRDKDVKWMRSKLFGDVFFEDISDAVAQIAVQGPYSKPLVAELFAESDIPQKYYSAHFGAKIGGFDVILSRTGYTGEFGYEIYTLNANAEKLWNILLDAGRKYDVLPCGLGCRDTLRLEAAMPLYGHEMDDTITPMEADLMFAVKLEKDKFIGRPALLTSGVLKRKRVGLKITGKGIAREHQDVYVGGKLVGHTTSGTHCPYLGGPYAMALLDIAYTPVGTAVEVDVRGRRVSAEVVALPFYKRT